MPPPCGHTIPVIPPAGKPFPATGYTPYCRLCWLFVTDPAYRQLWGGSDPTPTPGPAGEGFAERNFPCIYLGDVLDKLNCPCPAKWVRKCGLHDICTIDGCKSCPDYEPET
jgi:hypothetical protein